MSISGEGFWFNICPHVPDPDTIYLAPPDWVCPDCSADVVAEAEAAVET